MKQFGINWLLKQKTLRAVYPETLYNHSTRQVSIRDKVFNVGAIPGTKLNEIDWTHYVIDEKKLRDAVEGGGD